MIESKKLNAFGVRVPRFANIGFHPKLEVRPGTYKYPKLYPGCYYESKPRKVVSSVPSWKWQAKTGEYSRRLGYHGDHILSRNKWMKSINGPGWQELPSGLSTKGVAFSKAQRFRKGNLKDFAVPGPGTYGKDHVPYTRLEEKSPAKGYSFCTVPPFDRAGCVSRSMGVQRSYHLPPNLYNIKTPIEEFISKRISKRGPYQLFSGNRFPDLPPDRLSILPLWRSPSSWNHPKNSYKGKFLRCGKDSSLTSRLVLIDLALSPKNPYDPGPSDYDPYLPSPISQAKAPFNSSTGARPALKCALSAPPGRYQPEMKKKILGDGMKSVFLSKTERGIPLPEKLSWFQ